MIAQRLEYSGIEPSKCQKGSRGGKSGAVSMRDRALHTLPSYDFNGNESD
jgi:hypothetical protein